MSFIERLRAAETEEEFDALKDRLRGYINYQIFRNIFSPVVLRACILYLQPSKKVCIEIFYIVAGLFRNDLLEVFFREFLTLNDLTNTEELKKELFSFLKEEVIDGEHVHVLNFFIEKGIDIENKKPDGSARRDSSLLASAVLKQNVDIIDLLIKNGADVNASDKSGVSPVVYAMWSRDPRVLDLLIANGVNLHCRSGHGSSLWSVDNWSYYKEGAEHNYQRIADCGVPLDRDIYMKTYRSYLLNPKFKNLMIIMNKVMKKQGDYFFEVKE